MMHALAEAAASNGHTYLSWEALQKQSLKLLHDSGVPSSPTPDGTSIDGVPEPSQCPAHQLAFPFLWQVSVHVSMYL